MTDGPSIRIASVELPEDATSLCAIADPGDGTIVVSVNARFPEAEAHVRAHVARGFDTVLLCQQGCDGKED